jgi:rhodanese-related sulfurtransferase
MPESIALAQLKGLLADGVQLVDVLPPEEYAAEHLPGAVNVPLEQLDAETTAQLDKHRPVAVYCYDALCDMSPRAAWRLETLGFERVYHYVGGKVDWLAHALPREGQDLVPYAGELVEPETPTCLLSDSVADVRAALDGSRYAVFDRLLEGEAIERTARGGAPVGTGRGNDEHERKQDG